MKDEDAIQGLWRFVSRVSRGGKVHDAATHYLFRAGTFNEIVPDLVDDGTLRSTYQLDPRKRPKQIVNTLDYNGPDGPPDPNPIILKGYYSIEGDTLRLCWGLMDDFPPAFSDAEGSLVTLVRDPGPVPETKKPSGKPPIEDEVLGRLAWEDNFDWWSTTLRLRRGLSVEFSIATKEGGRKLQRALESARAFVKWLREHEQEARAYAADSLLELHNDTWNEGRPIGRAAFVKRMRLQSVAFSLPKTTLYYADGDLFWGHSILVTLDKQRRFKDAGIAG